MSGDQAHVQPASNPDALERRWADLADQVLIISREIQFQGYASPEAISLSPSEGIVMRFLHQNPGTSPSRLARATGLQRTNLSTVLRGLEDKGLIARRDSADDGRGVHIHPTPLGTSNFALVRHEWARRVAAAAADDSANLDAALTLLAKIAAGMVQRRQSGKELA
jgi:DNA-binding MarR family transcriptional regulator